MNREHIDAVKALLPAPVYVTKATANAARPYTVLHPDQGLPSAGDLAAVSDQALHRFQTTVVADGWEAAADRAANVSTALLDKRLTLSTEKTGLIVKDTSLPIGLDDSLPPGEDRWLARDVWSYVSISS